jgi:hypothetical protein
MNIPWIRTTLFGVLAACSLGAAAEVSSSANYRAQSVLGDAYVALPVASARYAIQPGARLDARGGRPAWTLAAHPAQPFAADAVTLRAHLASGASGATAQFSDNGQAIAGCTSVPLLVLPGSTEGEGVATCTVTAIAGGDHDYEAHFTLAGDRRSPRASTRVAASAAAIPQYTDLWWGGASENGWGVSITQHGATQFNVIYAYDASGKPTWYVMPGGSWDASRSTYSGVLYVPTSARFDAYDATRLAANAPVGTASLQYTSANSAVLSYTVDGVSGTKTLTRQAIALDDGQPRLQVNDHWWGGSGQNGWGISVAQQGRMLFVVWYSYDAQGRAMWRVVPGGTWNGSVFAGEMYATTSSPWAGRYDAAALAPVKVGTMTIDFVDQDFARVTYSLAGVTQTKTVARQPF